MVFAEARYDIGLSRSTLTTRECTGFNKTSKARLSLFSQTSRNCLSTRGQATCASRKFHMSNCCFTAGFRARSPSMLSFANKLGGKTVFKLCQLLSSTCLNSNDMTRQDARRRCICWRTVLLSYDAHCAPRLARRGSREGAWAARSSRYIDKLSARRLRAEPEGSTPRT